MKTKDVGIWVIIWKDMIMTTKLLPVFPSPVGCALLKTLLLLPEDSPALVGRALIFLGLVRVARSNCAELHSALGLVAAEGAPERL